MRIPPQVLKGLQFMWNNVSLLAATDQEREDVDAVGHWLSHQHKQDPSSLHQEREALLQEKQLLLKERRRLLHQAQAHLDQLHAAIKEPELNLDERAQMVAAYYEVAALVHDLAHNLARD